MAEAGGEKGPWEARKRPGELRRRPAIILQEPHFPPTPEDGRSCDYSHSQMEGQLEE